MKLQKFVVASALALGAIGAVAGTAGADPLPGPSLPAPSPADKVYGPYGPVAVTQYADGTLAVTVPTGIVTFQNGTSHVYMPNGEFLQ